MCFSSSALHARNAAPNYCRIYHDPRADLQHNDRYAFFLFPLKFSKYRSLILIVTDELLPGVAHRAGNALQARWYDLLAMSPTDEWSPFQIAIHDNQRRISQSAGGVILNGINYEIHQLL